MNINLICLSVIFFLSLTLVFNQESYAILQPPILTGGFSNNCNQNGQTGIGLNIYVLPTTTGVHIQKMVDNNYMWIDLTGKNYNVTIPGYSKNFTEYNDFAFTNNYSVAQMSCGHTYSYRVAADQGSTESSWSNTLTISPQFPSQNIITSVSDSIGISNSVTALKSLNGIILKGFLAPDQIGLTWTDSQPNIGWSVFRSVDNSKWINLSNTGCCVAVSGGPPLGYNDASIQSNHIYQYQVFTSGVLPQVSSNIITISTYGWTSTYNFHCTGLCLNYTQIDPVSSVQNSSAVFGLRINPHGLAFPDSDQVGFNTAHPIGNLNVNGAIPNNNNNIVLSYFPKHAVNIWFTVNGSDGVLHPRSAIIVYQNGTMLFSMMKELSDGSNVNIPMLQLDSSGKIYSYVNPDIRMNSQWINFMFNPDHSVTWQADPNPTMTSCTGKPHCD